MYRRYNRLVCAVILLLLMLPSVVLAEKPVVDIYMVYSKTCPHCHTVIKEVLPGILEKYGDQINMQVLEISDPTAFKVSLILEQLYQVPEEQSGVPEVFLDRTVMIGETVIRENLDKEIEKALAAGGFRLPTQEQLLSLIKEGPTAAPSPSAGQTVSGTATLQATPGVTSTATLKPTSVVTATATLEPATTPTSSVSVSPTVTLPPSPVVTASAPITAGDLPLTATPALSATAPLTPLVGLDAPPMHMAYFFEVGCSECDRATYVLNYLQTLYPNLAVDSFDVVKQAGMANWLADQYKLPASERLETPAVFIGTDYLIENRITVGNLQPILEKHKQSGTEAIWKDWQESQNAPAVAGLFQTITLPAVIGAGLIDGLNPCAFATIVFFIAYLAFTGRRGRDILITGAAFALGVFVAYLLLGLGLLRVLEAINVTTLGRWLYIGAAVLCLILAALNLSDFFKARRGKFEEMQMRLPLYMRRWINRVIREGSGVQAYALVAAATGFVIALLELACTGQIYIVILSALSLPQFQGQALSYLVVYNLAFIVPLVVVFLIAYFGVSSDDLALFVTRRTATVKLLTALLFLGLGLWLIYAFLPLFGVRLIGS